MSARFRSVVVLAVVVVGLALAALTLRLRDERYMLPAAGGQAMYLRSGATASRLMLSFKAIAADVYWMRTIQYYGRERKSTAQTGRFALLNPLLDLTTTLDPRFNIVYRFGAIFLSIDPPDGPAQPPEAIALLQKGLAANPTRWQYAHDIGFVHYFHTGNMAEAARWFEAASDMPGAPSWMRTLAATTLAEGGNRDAARTILEELLKSEDKYIRVSAGRTLTQLHALDDLDQLQALVAAYAARLGSYPPDMLTLMRAAGYSGVPTDPARVPYVYDSTTHIVSVSPRSPLNPMPKGFRAK